MKIKKGILELALALLTSIVCAIISIIGLVALFPVDKFLVISIGVVAETNKFVGVHWIFENWNKKIPIMLRVYSLMGIGVAMAITAIGIYGFLAKGHLEQSAPLAGAQIQIQQREDRINSLKADTQRLNESLVKMDKMVESFQNMQDPNSKNTNAIERANVIRNRQKNERLAAEQQIASNAAEIKKLFDELLPLKMQNSSVEAKLGPIKYVADLFGLTNPEAAVRIVIMMIMFATDPFALALLMMATISLREEKTEVNTNMQLVSNDPIEAVDKTQIDFINKVITSGNITQDAQNDVMPIIKTKKQPKKKQEKKLEEKPELKVVENNKPVVKNSWL